ncbi:MAG: peptidase M14, partial [Povalibacter sp.]
KQTIEFRGYEYTREPSAISGTLVTRYNNKKPQIWRIPLFDQVKPAVSAVAPRGGYIVPAAYAQFMQEKLKLHAIDAIVLSAAHSAANVESFRATSVKNSQSTFEGHTTATLAGEWKRDSRDVPAGSLFVPIAQARSQLAMTLLEPNDPDSFVSWGFFNTSFEQKEYMEAYVAEAVAEEMLKKDPAVKKEFERRLAEDPAFASSPTARLNFFYQRSSSWDERLNLYPVYRTDEVLK